MENRTGEVKKKRSRKTCLGAETGQRQRDKDGKEALSIWTTFLAGPSRSCVKRWEEGPVHMYISTEIKAFMEIA